jgi:branched-chain amino acid transport system permease protein
MAQDTAATQGAGPGAARRLDMAAVLKESLLAGFVAFTLFISMVGLRIVEVPGGQAIATRFVDVAVAVVLVFFGRMGMALTRAGFPLPVLIGAGVVAAIGTLVPMPSAVLQIIAVLGAIVLAFGAAKAMDVPMTVLISVAVGAVILGLALHVVSVTSSLLEIAMLWYGGLALAIGMTTHPRAIAVGRQAFGIPLWAIGVLALAAVLLGGGLYVLAATDTTVDVETRSGRIVAVQPLDEPLFTDEETARVGTVDGRTVTVPVVIPRHYEGATERVYDMDGTLRAVPVIEGRHVDGGVVALFALFYLYVVAAVVLAYRYRHMVRPAQDGRTADRVAARITESSRFIGPIGVLFAIALPFIFPDRSTIDLATLVLTYIMLGWGLNIIVGLAGLLDLGYVAFYAVGAYSYALLAVHFEWSFWVCLPLAGVFAASAGLLLGFPVLRLRGDYFAIVTLGFGEIIRIILLNWYQVTGGPDGISQIPRPSFFGIATFGRTEEDGLPPFHELFGLDYDSFYRVAFLYYLILVLALIVNFTSLRVRKLPIGRAWEAIREDDIACQSLGINRRNVKLAAFCFSAMFGGIAGSFFATRQTFISPESFTFIESAIILAIVVLGGMGSQTGVVLAAILLIGLPEIFRELEQYRMLAFGAAMVSIMIWRPRGLLAHRMPSVTFYDRKGRRATRPERDVAPPAEPQPEADAPTRASPGGPARGATAGEAATP